VESRDGKSVTVSGGAVDSATGGGAAEFHSEATYGLTRRYELPVFLVVACHFVGKYRFGALVF
jgi:hypothetical protein